MSSLIHLLTFAVTDFFPLIFKLRIFFRKTDTQRCVVETETPQMGQRARVCSARSCSNTSLFPHGGQECSHVSSHHCRRRWSRSQRWGVGDREKAGIPTSSITHCRVCLLPPDLQMGSAVWLSLLAALRHQPTIASASGKVFVHVSSRLWCVKKAGDSERRWISAAFSLYLLQTHGAIFPKGHRVNKTWWPQPIIKESMQESGDWLSS